MRGKQFLAALLLMTHGQLQPKPVKPHCKKCGRTRCDHCEQVVQTGMFLNRDCKTNCCSCEFK